MRFAWALLGLVLLAGPVHAAPVTFAIDLLFPPAPPNISEPGRFIAVGPQFNAGTLSFEDVLSSGTAQSLIPFEDLTSFQLNAVLTSFDPQNPGTTTISFTERIFEPSFGNTCVLGPGQCGLVFAGRQFFGFQGSFADRGTLLFPGGNLLNLAGQFDDFGTGFTQLRELSAAPVPEPSTWGILGLGVLIVAGRAWMARRREI
jgi:hypothetical protein